MQEQRWVLPGLRNKTGGIGFEPLGCQDISCSTHHPPLKREVPEPAASQERQQQPQAFANHPQHRLGDMGQRTMKNPSRQDTKITPCTSQLPEQQSPGKPVLWESLGLLFLGIINRTTAASKALNGEEGEKAI